LYGNLVLVWNDFIYEEAREVIERLWDRYSKKARYTKKGEVSRLLDLVFQLGHSVPQMPNSWPGASTDRDDDPFLWAAATGKAEYIISHDKRHMIILGTFAGIPIGNAKSFFDWVALTHPMPSYKGHNADSS